MLTYIITHIYTLIFFKQLLVIWSPFVSCRFFDPRILDGKFLHILFPARPETTWKLWDAPGWSLILLMVQKSQTTAPDVWNPLKNGINYHINWLAGFLNHQQYVVFNVSMESSWEITSWVWPCFLVGTSRWIHLVARFVHLARAGGTPGHLVWIFEFGKWIWSPGSCWLNCKNWWVYHEDLGFVH